MCARAQIVVDARGHRCPTPTLRLARALREADEGTLVRLLADDPLAKIDVPHFCAAVGAEVLASDLQGGHLEFLIRNGRGAPPGEDSAPPG